MRASRTGITAVRIMFSPNPKRCWRGRTEPQRQTPAPGSGAGLTRPEDCCCAAPWGRAHDARGRAISIKRARVLEVPDGKLEELLCGQLIGSKLPGRRVDTRTTPPCSGSVCPGLMTQLRAFQHFHKEQVRGQRSASGPWLCLTSRIQAKRVSVWLGLNQNQDLRSHTPEPSTHIQAEL